MLIIPAINAETFEEVKNKLELIKPYTDWAHIDVADGSFAGNILWHNPEDIKQISGLNLNLEVHLMISSLEDKIDKWLKPEVKRILFHLNAVGDPDIVIKKCEEIGIEVGISISPDESVEKALTYKDKVDFFQILAVKPGLPGQKMDESAFEKIKEVRKFCSSCMIEVDGGMNLETIPKAIEFGANRIVAASAIFDTGKDIKESIEKLKNVI
ncbi:MAG: hypothetical protein Q8Q21_00050 [bacterium]|nr:hypothetical protein [bacterium]